MAGSLNRVTLVGNCGGDPEIKQTTQGVPFANFSLATSESYKDREGQKKEHTDWHRVTVWGRHDGDSLCTIVEKYVRKGSKILVEGQLKTRKWQAQDGTDRYSTEVVLRGFDAKLLLLGDSGGGGSRPPPPASPDEYGSSSSRPQANRPASDPDVDDSDIPF
ncbi:MAG: single-stranded DNA-binding protein [Dehalococcoidia bacterium]